MNTYMMKSPVYYAVSIQGFKDKSEGVKLNRPEHVQIGHVVVAYDDWGTWRVEVWSSEEFEKKFIKVDG